MITEPHFLFLEFTFRFSFSFSSSKSRLLMFLNKTDEAGRSLLIIHIRRKYTVEVHLEWKIATYIGFKSTDLLGFSEFKGLLHETSSGSNSGALLILQTIALVSSFFGNKGSSNNFYK